MKFKMVELINYDKLDVLVKEYEAFKQKHFLDMDEEKLLLDILSERRKQKYQDMLTGVRMKENPMMRMSEGLLKKFGVVKEDDKLD